MNNKGVSSLIAGFIVFSLISIGILIAVGQINLGQISGSGSYIERPVFYYDKCTAIAGLTYSAEQNLATAGQWITPPSVSSSYDVEIIIPKAKLFSGTLIEYYVCNQANFYDKSNCRIYSQTEEVERRFTNIGETRRFTIKDVRGEEHVWVQYQSITFGNRKGLSGALYKIAWVPYGIKQYNVLAGGNAPIVSDSCTYPSSQTDTILSTDADKVKSIYSGVDESTNERVLQPEEERWYVAGYLTSAGPSFALTYQGKEAWCRQNGNNAEIYAINEIKTSGGTYKIASADYSDYLGIAGVCCPSSTRGSDVCNKNFQWEVIEQAECGAFKSCGSVKWVPYTEKQLIRYSCINGKCQSETKKVSCASNFDCNDANQICDLNIYECVEANVNLKGDYIATVPDDASECSAKGGKWITKSSQDYSIWNRIGIGKPDTVVTEYCKMAKPVNWFLWIMIGIVLLFLIIFWRKIVTAIKVII